MQHETAKESKNGKRKMSRLKTVALQVTSAMPKEIEVTKSVKVRNFNKKD
jgi:hypothetical protein